MNKYWLSIFFGLIFFIAGLLTLNHYGISWDEPVHFSRGQAYLHWFLTGEKDYEKVPAYDLKKAREDPNYHQRSIFQNYSFNIDYYMTHDGGHPPLNGILASLFNHIFYQKLGILGDVESYHLFEIFISAILISVVFLFSFETFGIWTGVLATLFLSTYPLFWAESHFNIKDPIETAFFTLTIYFLWKGVVSKKSKMILIAAFFAGLALSTKFNILFIPFIILPWLLLRHFWLKINTAKIIFSKKMIFTFAIFPLIMFLIFFLTWPYLWQDLYENTLTIFKYYKEIGTETEFQPNFIVGQWNTYALRWILYTTPPVLLLFFILGLFSLGIWTKQKREVLVLWIFWFAVTIFRVSIPKATIYGGVRQIMEYIPAMAFIGAVGVLYFQILLSHIFQKFKIKVSDKILKGFFLIVILLSLVIPLVKLHPNENVYFNFLSGGLKKVLNEGVPAAGNSFGNAYWQGIMWFNQNAESNAKLSLVQATILNIPSYKLRSDIQYSNYFWSGIKRDGEYLIELIYNYEVKVYHYAWEYAEKMLEPVYIVKVDGVPILKIWKNDLAHTKEEFQKKELPYKGVKEIQINGPVLQVTVPEKILLSRVVVHYTKNESCVPVTSGFVQSSLDGQNWFREGDPIPYDQLGRKGEIEPNSFRYMFAARETKYIRMNLDNIYSCGLNNPTVDLVVLE